MEDNKQEPNNDSGNKDNSLNSNNDNLKHKQNRNSKYMKLANAFLEVFDDLQVSDNVWTLKNWAKQNPGEFFKLISKMLPNNIKLDSDALDELVKRIVIK